MTLEGKVDETRRNLDAAIARADREEAARKTAEEHLGLAYKACDKLVAERDEARAARDKNAEANAVLNRKLAAAESRVEQLASEY